MSDTDGKKPLGLGGGARGPGQVKQSFSHGRTKSVAVEVKRKRVVVPQKPGPVGSGSGSPTYGDPSKRPAGISDVEMERRLAALRLAKAREAEDTAKRAADEKAREEERQRRRDEIEARDREEREMAEAAARKAEEEARLKAEEESRIKREAEIARRAANAPARVAAATSGGIPGAVTPADEPRTGKPGAERRRRSYPLARRDEAQAGKSTPEGDGLLETRETVARRAAA